MALSRINPSAHSTQSWCAVLFMEPSALHRISSHRPPSDCSPDPGVATHCAVRTSESRSPPMLINLSLSYFHICPAATRLPDPSSVLARRPTRP